MTNIYEYCNDFENAYNDSLTEFECLEVRLFTERSITNEPCNQDYICEFLITYGGPTVRFTVDSRYPMAELFHSWGVDHDGNRKETIEVSREVTRNFFVYIEEIYNV